jgi:hypothetical protein
VISSFTRSNTTSTGRPTRSVVVRALDDVRVEADALVELDDGHVVRHVVEERRMLGAVGPR